MESKNRRTEIRIETHQLTIIRDRKAPQSVYCERCGDIVTALTPEQPAEVPETTQDDLRRWPYQPVCK